MRATDFGQLDEATAKRLLAEYTPVVKAMCRLYPHHVRDDFVALGQVAVLEAVVSHDPSRSAQATWIRWLVRRRLRAELARENAQAAPIVPLDDSAELSTAPEVDLGSLTGQQQTIVRAHHNGEPLAAIAERLGVRRQHVHRQYQRGLKKLRQTVEERRQFERAGR